MTSQLSVKQHRSTTSLRVDLLRLVANLAGLFGAFFILLSAGSSDAGLLSVGELVGRITLGAALLLLWRTLSFFAGELDRKRRRTARRV